MFAFNNSFIRTVGALLLLMMLAVAFNARAAVPDADKEIGTEAIITYIGDDGLSHELRSNRVLTKIAQVYGIAAVQMTNPVRAKPGAEADIPFVVTNTGNGVDNVKLSVPAMPPGVTKISLYRADAGGAPDLATGVDFPGSTSLELSGMARGEQRNFVARFAVSNGSKNDDDIKFNIDAVIGDAATIKIEAVAKVLTETHFKVVRGQNVVTLDAKKQASVSFTVKDATAAKRAYFELFLVNSSDPSKELPYTVVGNASFDQNPVANADIDKTVLPAKIVGQIRANTEPHLSMKIEVPGAKLGDKFLMRVRYSEAASTGIASLDSNKLLTSDGVELVYPHSYLLPMVEVTKNNVEGSMSPFEVVTAATSGRTIDYSIKLKNQSTESETFSMEALRDPGLLIENITLVDGNGLQVIPPGDGGFPETGLIAPGAEFEFKLRVKLIEGQESSDAQKVKLKITSLRPMTLDSISKNFVISTVTAGATPEVEFFSADDTSKALASDGLKLSGGETVAKFLMKVSNPNASATNPRQHRIEFDGQDTKIRRYDGNVIGAPLAGNTAAIGSPQWFHVTVDMRGVTTRTKKATVTDVVSTSLAMKSINITRLGAVGFGSNNYPGRAALNADTVLKVVVVNHGGDMDAGLYELVHIDGGASSPTEGWKLAFSWDGNTWEDKLALKKMDDGAKSEIAVRIRVPGNANVHLDPSLTLALRKTGGTANAATTVVTLQFAQSELMVVKSVVAVAKAVCNGTAPAFNGEIGPKVTQDDCIWYQVVVTNPQQSPVAKNVSIKDLLPEHSAYTAGTGNAEIQGTSGTESVVVKLNDGHVETSMNDLAPGESLTLKYRVDVDLKK